MRVIDVSFCTGHEPLIPRMRQNLLICAPTGVWFSRGFESKLVEIGETREAVLHEYRPCKEFQMLYLQIESIYFGYMCISILKVRKWHVSIKDLQLRWVLASQLGPLCAFGHASQIQEFLDQITLAGVVPLNRGNQTCLWPAVCYPHHLPLLFCFCCWFHHFTTQTKQDTVLWDPTSHKWDALMILYIP